MTLDDTLRQMFMGADPRRMVLDPADRARAEALCAQYGGVLEMRPGRPGELVFQWLNQRGESVLVAGASAAECLRLIHEAITADHITYLH